MNNNENMKTQWKNEKQGKQQWKKIKTKEK
jgi:hypothetical protein